MYEAINGLAPFYPQELVTLKEACKHELRFVCDGLLLNPAKFKTYYFFLINLNK